jgi:hypothetical protein
MVEFAEVLEVTSQRLAKLYDAVHETAYPHPDEGKPRVLAENERKAKHQQLLGMEIIRDFNPLLCSDAYEYAAQYRAAVLAALDVLDPAHVRHIETAAGEEFKYRINNDPYILEGMEEIGKFTRRMEKQSASKEPLVPGSLFSERDPKWEGIVAEMERKASTIRREPEKNPTPFYSHDGLRILARTEIAPAKKGGFGKAVEYVRKNEENAKDGGQGQTR